jgi:hypothetical protein
MIYYVIPISVIDSISFYIKTKKLSTFLDCNDNNVLQSLEVNDIHTNNGDVIKVFLRIFKMAIYEMEKSGLIDEIDNIKVITKSLKKRKEAIDNITTDVLKRLENCCY